MLPAFLPTRYLLNPRARQVGLGDDARAEILSRKAADKAFREISSWKEYAPTPLRSLDGLARRLGLESLLYKDEAGRLGLGSFKALGGPYGVLGVLLSHLREEEGVEVPSSEALRNGRYAHLLDEVTVTCASTGNHGRAVALGARLFGCRSVVFLPSGTAPDRVEAIREVGARVAPVDGSYDDAVARAAREAEERGWYVVSDTAYPGYVEVPARIMQGYTVMVREVLQELSGDAPAIDGSGPDTGSTDRRPEVSLPTHVFLQAGVGGMAAAVSGYLRETLGPRSPVIVVVEPDEADCLFECALAGAPGPSRGSLETSMSCLACREASILAWPILEASADAFLTLPDPAVEDTLRLLEAGTADDPSIRSRPSGVAGLAGLAASLMEPSLSEPLGLGADSRVLVFGTEGPGSIPAPTRKDES
jgi:diaminopropionate ammonia-lyase